MNALGQGRLERIAVSEPRTCYGRVGEGAMRFMTIWRKEEEKALEIRQWKIDAGKTDKVVAVPGGIARNLKCSGEAVVGPVVDRMRHALGGEGGLLARQNNAHCRQKRPKYWRMRALKVFLCLFRSPLSVQPAPGQLVRPEMSQFHCRHPLWNLNLFVFISGLIGIRNAHNTSTIHDIIHFQKMKILTRTDRGDGQSGLEDMHDFRRLNQPKDGE